MNEDIKIKYLKLENMHGHQSSELNLFPGLNIIYGKNGTGKTTLLHTIVNLLEIDIDRFLQIRFDKIFVTTYSNENIKLTQDRKNGDETVVSVFLNGDRIGVCTDSQSFPQDGKETLGKLFAKRPVYLPAYRPVLEGTLQGRRYPRRIEHEFPEAEYNRILEKEIELLRQKRGASNPPYVFREQADLIAYKTLLCRSWFGDFVPIIRYPSISEVHSDLEDEIEKARYIVAAQDENNISTVFRRVLEVTLADKPKAIDENIDDLVERVRSAVIDLGPGSADVPAVYGEIAEFLKNRRFEDNTASDKIKGILKVYDDALSTRATNKSKAYANIDTFMNSVNRFLETKPLGYEYRKIPRRVRGKTFVELPDGSRVGFNVLSSGERHVLTLLFAATHMSPFDGIVVIDEPELSLHVDWQRIIIGEISKQSKERQIIACTHSPEVAAEHVEAYIELINIPSVQKEQIDGEQTEIDLEA